MKKIPKKGDYIIFIPKSRFKNELPIDRHYCGYNFVGFPELTYNKRYKIINTLSVNKNNKKFVIIDNRGMYSTSYSLERMDLNYEIVFNLKSKVNKIIEL